MKRQPKRLHYRYTFSDRYRGTNVAGLDVAIYRDAELIRVKKSDKNGYVGFYVKPGNNPTCLMTRHDNDQTWYDLDPNGSPSTDKP